MSRKKKHTVHAIAKMYVCKKEERYQDDHRNTKYTASAMESILRFVKFSQKSHSPPLTHDSHTYPSFNVLAVFHLKKYIFSFLFFSKKIIYICEQEMRKKMNLKKQRLEKNMISRKSCLLSKSMNP